MDKINSNNFDFLRIVFAATVVISHLIELSQVTIFKNYSHLFNARLAIDGFFVISGFLIAKSYKNSKSIKAYLLKRIKRIVPAYVFVILFCALSFCLISTKSVSDYFLNTQFWSYLIANLTFQNYIQPCLPGVFHNNLMCAVNGALWTIKLEEAFYLLIPLFYLITKWKKKNIYTLSLIVYLLSIAYFNYFVSENMYRIAKQLPGALAFFTIGIIFFTNFKFFIKWKHYFILPCLVLFILEHFIWHTQLFKPAVFGFMVFYIAYTLKFLNNFGKFGDLTYGLYIYHFPLIQLFVHLEYFKNYNPIVISVILITLLIIISGISWHFLELKYLSENRKTRQKNLFAR